MSFRALEGRLRNYLDGGRYYKIRATLPYPGLAKRLNFRPPTDFEREMAFTDLRWRVQHSAKAETEAASLAVSNPASPKPHELLAAIYMDQGETAKALKEFRRAVELNTASEYAKAQVAILEIVSAKPPAVAVSPFKAPEALDKWDEHNRSEAAALAGNVSAMFQVAVDYACGLGAEFDPTQALYWIKRAAGEGHSTAGKIAATSEADAEKVVRLIRDLGIRWTGIGDLPPIESELQAKISATVALGKDAPLTPVYRPLPRYPKESHGTPGTVMVTLTVDETGHPRDVFAPDASSPAFAAAATRCVLQWRFVPAIKDGKAVATKARVSIGFKQPR